MSFPKAPSTSAAGSSEGGGTCRRAHKAPEQLYGFLFAARTHSKRLDVLANLIEETLKKRGVAADDPFRGKFAERLVEEAQRQRPALDRSDLAGARDPDNDGLPHPKTLNLICLKI